MAMVYYRQEKYELAEFHFRRAIQINPFNSVLYCYLGMALHALYKSNPSSSKPREDCLLQALKALETSIKLNPGNTVAKFNRARVLRSMKRLQVFLSSNFSLSNF